MECLMTDTSILAPFVDGDPDSYSELVSSCGKIIDAWLACLANPAPFDPANSTRFEEW